MKIKHRISALVSAIVAILLLYLWSFYAAHFMGAIWNSDEMSNYKTLPSKTIIKELRFHLDPFYDPHYALQTLVERKDKAAVSQIIKMLNSHRSYYRQEAMRALANLGDSSAIEPLVNIVNRTPIDINYSKTKPPDNIEALIALSKLKYEKIYGKGVELATLKNDPNDFRSYGITMLSNFEKPESLPILEKISQNDPEGYIRAKAKKAIERIKSVQK